MSRPTEAEILELALEPDIDLEFERVMRMTDAEVRASLKARGHDLRVLEVEAAVFWKQTREQKIHGGYLAGGMAVAGSLAAALSTMLGGVASTTIPLPIQVVPTVLNLAAASAPPVGVRAAALDACSKSDWQRCIDKLNEARESDPDGEKQPEIVAARKLAEQKLGKDAKP